MTAMRLGRVKVADIQECYSPKTWACERVRVTEKQYGVLVEALMGGKPIQIAFRHKGRVRVGKAFVVKATKTIGDGSVICTSDFLGTGPLRGATSA